MLRLLLTSVSILLLGSCGAEQSPSTSEALFDGRSFAGWTVTGGERSFIVEGDGVLAFGDAPGRMVSERSFGDMVLQCQIRSDAMSSAQLAVGCDAQGNNGAVIALADMAVPMAGGEPCGSISSHAPAVSAAMQPTGSWNDLRVQVRGSSVAVSVNGVATAQATVKLVRNGFVALLGKGEFFWLRNLQVKRL